MDESWIDAMERREAKEKEALLLVIAISLPPFRPPKAVIFPSRLLGGSPESSDRRSKVVLPFPPESK